MVAAMSTYTETIKSYMPDYETKVCDVHCRGKISLRAAPMICSSIIDVVSAESFGCTANLILSGKKKPDLRIDRVIIPVTLKLGVCGRTRDRD